MEKDEIIKAKVKEMIKKEDVAISTKKETTTSDHIIKENVETILFRLKAANYGFKHKANIAESRKEYVSGFPVVNILNGVCETWEIGKKNRTSFPTEKSWRAKKILETVHSYLRTIELPVHGGNKCPTKSVYDKTLEKDWSGRRPSIRHLRVFGCIVYARVLNQLSKKLDDKDCEPVTFKEASSDENWRKAMDDEIWRKAIDDEIHAIEKRNIHGGVSCLSFVKG
ncbi:hypothetical protein CR513_12825, partial [Mucuna pruriens]